MGADATERLAFLLRASELLAESLDYEETLKKVAALAVPAIADWCSIDLVDEEGRPRNVAVAHADPDKVRFARELQERFPPDPDAPTGTPNVIRSGEPEFYPEITAEVIAAAGVDDPELLDIIRELGLQSSMNVPLLVGNRVLGAMSLVGAESGQRFGPEDLRFAQDLARRAALAIDTARRYGEQQEATERSEERFRLLVDNMSDYAIFMLNPDGTIATWNEGAKRIKGYEADEIIGKHFSTFYAPDAIAARHPDYELEVATAEGRYAEEGWRVRKDGTRFYASVVITALYDNAGELRGFGKVTRDITERMEAQERLAAATAEAERHRLRRAHALEIHDNIIQGLVLAKYAQEYGDVERAAVAVDQVLTEARRIVGDLQAETGPTEPGQLRREREAPSLGAPPAS